MSSQPEIPNETIDRVDVRAYDYASSYDLKQVRSIVESDGRGRVLNADPLLIEMEKQRIVAVFDYGSMVFFGFSEEECAAYAGLVAPAATRPNRTVSEDEFVLYLAPRQKRPEGTEELTITELSRDIALVVGTVLSRSVSLEYYEKLVESVLSQLEGPIASLQQTGRVPHGNRELTKRIGLSLAVELELAHTLAIFDDPGIVWDGGKKIGELYASLKREFDLDDRIRIIQQKISIVSRSTTFVISRLEALRSQLLEWIIILLILLEVLLFVLG